MTKEVDYKSARDFDCPLCEWSLHVEKDVWDKFPDQHEQILFYIQSQLDTHAREIHGVNNVNSLSKLTLYSKSDINIDNIKKSPYIGMSDETI